MKKIVFLFILCVHLCRGATYTNEVYNINEIISNSVALIGEANEEIGDALASNADMSGDNTPEIAMTGDKSMRVFYGTNTIAPNTYNLTPSNSFLYQTTDYGTYATVDFIQHFNTSDYACAVTSGPNIINDGRNVMQVVGIFADYPENGATNYLEINGTNGFRIIGTSNNYYIAYEVHGVNDMTGNGLDELAHYSIGIEPRRSIFVWYGSSNQLKAAFTPDEINGTNGFRITDGYNFSSGDFNSDSRGDIAVTTTAGLSLVYGRQRFVNTLSAINLPPEDGVVIKKASIGRNGGFGDINGDGIDDIILNGGIVVFGRTNWGTDLDTATMGLGEIMHPTSSVARIYFGGWCRCSHTAVIGDLNGDGYDDWAIDAIQEIQISPPMQSNKFLVVYGKPIYPVNMEMWLLDSTNGFAILDPFILSKTRGGDWDSDGYEEAIFGMPWAADHNGIVTITPGGPSPAWSPYIFKPELIMEGRSKAVASTVLTNIVTGRKGKRHMVLSDGPEPIEQEWLGTWFTTKVVRTSIDDTRTVNYWTTNILGRSNPATTLVINAVPEPGMIMAAMMIVIGIMTGRKSKS